MYGLSGFEFGVEGFSLRLSMRPSTSFDTCVLSVAVAMQIQ